MSEKSVQNNSVSNCTFTNSPAPANEHTRAAVESLAQAATANAQAIAEIARALRGGNADMSNVVRFPTSDDDADAILSC